jgi:SNF2 family DNA or RNA helicase
MNVLKNSFSKKLESILNVSIHDIENLEQTNCSLILVNISLLSQWIMELNRTLLKYIAIYTRNDIEGLDTSKYDVVLVANNVYNMFAQVNKKKSWKRFIIDEPVSLKIVGMENTNAMFYWLITATPLELYMKRRVGFLNDLLPDDASLFNYLIVKNKDEFVKKSYKMPFTRHIHYKCSDNISKFFEDIVNENIIEMIEAANLYDVISSFGSEEYKNLYDAFLDKKFKRIEELNLLNTYSKINEKDTKCNYQEKIEIVEKQIKTFGQRLFSFIFNTFSCVYSDNGLVVHKPSIFSCCQHICCKECSLDIEKLQSDQCCPYCKNTETQILSFENWDRLYNTYLKDSLNSESLSRDVIIKNKQSKISTILDIVREDKKILIFSNYNETFTIIKRFLEDKKLKYLELKGTKERRDNTIDMYKTGKINILLLNTIASGAGLNLQETTDIILYHRLPEFQKIQVLGRANRIGREVELTVHYLE